jgi:hypothetical protein
MFRRLLPPHRRALVRVPEKACKFLPDQRISFEFDMMPGTVNREQKCEYRADCACRFVSGVETSRLIAINNYKKLTV